MGFSIPLTYQNRLAFVKRFDCRNVAIVTRPLNKVVELPNVEPESPGLAEALSWIDQHGGPYWVFYSRVFHSDPARPCKRRLLESPQVTFRGSWAGVEPY